MALTLHAATIPAWLQIIASTRALVDKAEAWCTDTEEAEDAVLGASLAEGMWSFNWQINSVWMHSAHAVCATESGTFEPNFTDIPGSFGACRAKLDTARDTLLAVAPGELESRAEDNLDFVLGGTVRMSFTAQDFLLSFSNPNFYFHAATAYDILRMKGLEIGKRDYLGTPAIKPS